MKYSFLLISLSFLLTIARSQNSVLETGNLVSITQSGQSFNIKTKTTFARVMLYSNNVIRIRMDKKPLEPDFSYAVVAEPEKLNVRFIQDEKSATILTDSLKLVIGKSPLSFSFQTAGGKIINEDEPGLNTSWVGEEVTAYRHMQDKERFVGLGEKTGDLDRTGNGYTNWNTDAYGYATNLDPIYSSIPFYMGFHHGLSYGVFLDNSYQTDFNFGASTDRFSSFGARHGEMNYYFIWHSRVADIIRSYTWLTGRMHMPPLWSLGYQQNRYTYYPDTEVIRIAQTLREKKIPADGITLDIHYMDRYQLFTWDRERFPDPKAMTSKLKSMGFETTVIVDPGIKIEPGAPAFERGLKADVYIKYADGKNYAGKVWPGWCYFTDYTSEKGRAFWKKEVKFFSDNGVKGIWNDMNEIATWGQKMSSNIIFDWEGRKTTNLQAHNVYGLLMAKSSYEGARAATNERPFILTRAGFAGLQRYSAIWTGDNRSEDDHMLLGVRLLNSLGLSGVPFTGMDVGGFIGSPTPELYARWMQLGAFTPYFRNHSALNTRSAEPWTFGEHVTEIVKNYVSLRYTLMPYLYSSFYESTQSGIPVSRSLVIENPFDDKIYAPDYQNEFCFGPSILVAPTDSKKSITKVYLPSGDWYDFYNDERIAGKTEKYCDLSLQKLPVFVKAGSIIPMQSLVQTTSEKPSDTLFIHLYKGSLPNQYIYYEDDGRSFDNERGIFYRRAISYDPSKQIVVFEKPEGNYRSHFRAIKLVLHGFDPSISAGVNGKSVSSKSETCMFLNVADNFAPAGHASGSEYSQVYSFIFENSNDRFTVKL
jgi:alpha-glucosidase